MTPNNAMHRSSRVGTPLAGTGPCAETLRSARRAERTPPLIAGVRPLGTGCAIRKISSSAEYSQLLRHLEYSLLELPAGVLFGPDAATAAQCAKLMRMTYRLEDLAKVRGIDVSDLMAKCRWHYE